MDGIHIRSKSLGNQTIHVDTSEFNRALDKAQNDIADQIRKTLGKVLSEVKSEIYNYIRNYPDGTANKVANSLDYEREVNVHGNEIDTTAEWGSRGPNGRNGEIGVGVHTSPDDSGGTYNIGEAFDEGREAHFFKWKGLSGKKTAFKHGRQVGREGTNTPWYGKGKGGAFFYGFPRLNYIEKGAEIFERRFEGRLQKALNRRLG